MMNLDVDIWIFKFLLLLNAVNLVVGRLGAGIDCSQERLFFKRRDATSYYCVKASSNGNSFESLGGGVCADQFNIPTFIGVSATDPCICRQSGLLAGGRVICAPYASAGLRSPGSQSQLNTLDTMYISDTGCPGPFQRYINTYRNSSGTISTQLPLTGGPFSDAVEECKFRCLVRGSCSGVSFGPRSGRPSCIEFPYSNVQDFQHQISGNHQFAYFGKLRVCSEHVDQEPVTSPPVEGTTLVGQEAEKYTPTEPTSGTEQRIPVLPGANSIISNAKQLGGSVLAQGQNITSTECYKRCTQLQACKAADYNFGTKECWIHTSTHCSSHVIATDHCCDHFKKGIICFGGNTIQHPGRV